MVRMMQGIEDDIERDEINVTVPDLLNIIAPAGDNGND